MSHKIFIRKLKYHHSILRWQYPIFVSVVFYIVLVCRQKQSMVWWSKFKNTYNSDYYVSSSSFSFPKFFEICKGKVHYTVILILLGTYVLTRVRTYTFLCLNYTNVSVCNYPSSRFYLPIRVPSHPGNFVNK